MCRVWKFFSPSFSIVWKALWQLCGFQCPATVFCFCAIFLSTVQVSITKHNTQTDTHTHSRSSFCKLMCDLCCLCGHRVLMTGHMSHWPPSSLLSTLPMRQLVSLRRPISLIHPDALEIHKLLVERVAEKRMHILAQKKYQVLILYMKHLRVTKRPV